MRATLTAAVTFLLSMACSAPASRTPLEPADRVFLGGRIWTANEVQPWASALAIRDGRIVAVGDDVEVGELCGPETQVERLSGQLVTPGFIDSHLHFLQREQVQIEEADVLDDVARRVREFGAAHPNQEWIIGRGWGYSLFPGGRPHRRYLDAMLAERPLVLTERDGHMSVCNSRALELAGVTRDTPEPAHGRIVRDDDGEPTGELHESAMGLVSRLIPPASEEELIESLMRQQERAASFGLTSVCNASYSPRSLELLRWLVPSSAFRLRFRFAVPFQAEAGEQDFAQWRALQERFPREWVSFGCAKGMLDGVVDAQTAYMFEPFTTGVNGIAMWEQDALNAAAARYDAEGFQLLFHCCGDRATDMALSAFEHVERANGTRDRRPRVEHAEVVRERDLPRFRALRAIASTQALFATPDATTLENYSPLLGPERARDANAFKRFDDAGVRQAFGSDFPVFSMEVLEGIYVAAARKTLSGAPPGGYFPEHCISVEAALRHFTIDGAYANFLERECGSLEVGKFADLVVLSDDLFAPPLERVLATEVVLTVVGGRDSFRRAPATMATDQRK